ncbi:MAG: hypothetical protein PUC12_12745, partial [Clostridiales bacterium]|nr:hypothetical protein [Clostridiales bacterium]
STEVTLYFTPLSVTVSGMTTVVATDDAGATYFTSPSKSFLPATVGRTVAPDVVSFISLPTTTADEPPVVLPPVVFPPVVFPPVVFPPVVFPPAI